MGKKKLIGYVYHNGLWYRQYKTFREVCSEAEIIEHTKRVENVRADMWKGGVENDNSI